MKRIILAAGVTATLIATPVLAMTEAECTAAWAKIDTKNAGIVGEPEAARYIAALRVAKTPAVDGKLTRVAFLEHCKSGHFDNAVTDAGAPLSGSNSFTEAQAKDRVMAAGFSTVSALVKDANGVWRGTVTDGAQSKQVAVDFKGNVVIN